MKTLVSNVSFRRCHDLLLMLHTSTVLDGANPSAEGEDEEEGGSGGGEQVEKVPELVLAFGLTKMLAFSKDEYKSHIKSTQCRIPQKINGSADARVTSQLT